MGIGDLDLIDDGDGGGKASSNVSCSICLEIVADSGDRAWAKLHCGHFFHLGNFLDLNLLFIFCFILIFCCFVDLISFLIGLCHFSNSFVLLDCSIECSDWRLFLEVVS